MVMEEVKSWGVVANPNFEYCREAEMMWYVYVYTGEGENLQSGSGCRT